jgi:hypothetical protein
MFVASSGGPRWRSWRLARSLDAEKAVCSTPRTPDELALRHTQARTALRWGFVGRSPCTCVGGALQARDPVWGLAATLWILLPLATWLSARGTRSAHAKASAKSGLQPPAPRARAAAILARAAVARSRTTSSSRGRNPSALPTSLEQVARADRDRRPADVGTVLLLAVSPAICEELFFRGALLSGLRRDLAAGA